MRGTTWTREMGGRRELGVSARKAKQRVGQGTPTWRPDTAPSLGRQGQGQSTNAGNRLRTANLLPLLHLETKRSVRAESRDCARQARPGPAPVGSKGGYETSSRLPLADRAQVPRGTLPKHTAGSEGALRHASPSTVL